MTPYLQDNYDAYFIQRLVTCSDLELSIFWKIKKESSRTTLALLKKPIVIEWYLFENAARRFPAFGQKS